MSRITEVDIKTVHTNVLKKLASSVWNESTTVREGNVIQLNKKSMGEGKFKEFILTACIDATNDHCEEWHALLKDDFIFLLASVVAKAFNGTVEEWQAELKDSVNF